MRLVALGFVSLTLAAIVGAQSALGGQVFKPLEAPEKDRFIKVGGLFAKRLDLKIDPAAWVVTPTGKGTYNVVNGDGFTFVMDSKLMVQSFNHTAHIAHRAKHFTPNPAQSLSDDQWISKATDHATKLWANVGIASTEISPDFPTKDRDWADNNRRVTFRSVPQDDGRFKYVIALFYAREDGKLIRVSVSQHGL
jgi:hypothetical protein